MGHHTTGVLSLYLPSLRKPQDGNTPNNPHNFVCPTWLGKLRRVRYALRHGYPFDGIEAWGPLLGRGKWVESE